MRLSDWGLEDGVVGECEEVDVCYFAMEKIRAFFYIEMGIVTNTRMNLAYEGAHIF